MGPWKGVESWDHEVVPLLYSRSCGLRPKMTCRGGIRSNLYFGSSMVSPSSQRTPSRASPRGKGKAKTVRACAKQQLQIEKRANWTSDLTKDFLQCCANDIEQFGSTSNSLDPAGWFRVTIAFNNMTNSHYKKTQLKNRWDQLKRDWAAWNMLIDPSQTGLGWDYKKHTVTGPDHWWGLMINRRKEAAKFKNAGLEHKDLMERVFRDVTAMGEGAYIPRTWHERMEDVRSEDSRELESDGSNSIGMEDPFQTPNKRLKSGGGGTSMPMGSASHRSTRKSSASKADLFDSINELLQAVKKKNQDCEKRQRAKAIRRNNQDCEKRQRAEARAEAIRRVKALPVFRDMHKPEIEELRWWALRHLEKIRKVKTFLACNTDAERHQWLYFENLAAIEEHHRGRGMALQPPRFPPPTYDED
ncbi:hypothetical protein Vadar_030147 [Vaccinium darrowii]|uniref:Uncharacterized protein n=1 Tax=Vaccinium darrowii TaxID=229202 RepID=A0ACB7XM50_9ERIC|nr:hypothetical protein Vadar_030147 [Vaccinium darrowii]